MIPVSKIAVLGGSSVNTPEFFEALRQEQIQAEEVCLVGRTEEKLNLVARFSQRLCEELGLDTRITHTTDARHGLAGAQFVINQIRVGGANVWNRCWHIMRSFGIGGMAAHYAGLASNLNVVLDLARISLSACPRAWFIHFTNPCGMHAEAFARYTPELKVITGCNFPLKTRIEVAELLGSPVDDPSQINGVETAWFGFNHCAWIQNVTADDSSLMHEVIRRNAKLEKPKWDVKQIERFGVIPAGRAAGLFEKPVAPENCEERAREFQADTERDAQALALYADSSLRATEALSRKQKVGWYHLAIAPIIAGLAGKTPRRYYCAMPAVSAMRDFPEVTVECAVTLCDGSVTPLPLEPMPRSIRAMCDLLRASEELAIVAAVTRSRKVFIEALAIHPGCPSLQQAEQVTDFLIGEVPLELYEVH